MAYSELIKNFAHIRDYMRQFFVYGFKRREEYKQKSSRSYDNERRRIEGWLGDYMTFRQESSGKTVFMSIDSRRISRNPLYTAWKAAGFTKNDISLHFLLMDLLPSDAGEAKTVPEILDIITSDYLPAFVAAEPTDESTLRKKLREYVALGLIAVQKKGKQLAYYVPKDTVCLDTWQDAVSFFAEDSALGVIGSFLLDKFDTREDRDIFSFKHHYLLFTLDSGIMLDLLGAIHNHTKVYLELFVQQGPPRHSTTLPLKIFISTQGGRQYLAGCNPSTGKLHFFRLDSIQKVKLLEKVPDYINFQESLSEAQSRCWGVATGGCLEHIEMILHIEPPDIHIARRLEREKRCGHVTQLTHTIWRFWADIYDAQELFPWLRTFIGRILSLTCSNKQIQELFWKDISAMTALYEGDSHAIQ